MSNPSDGPEPAEPGSEPPPRDRPVPPGRSGRFPFELPADRPRNLYEAMPQGGFTGLFSVTGLPMELKVSYWIWVIGGLLGLLGGVIGIFGALVLFAFIPGLAVLVLLLVLFAVALSGAQIVLALKMKEGREWARLALTAIAGASLLLSFISVVFTDGRGGNGLGFLASLAATVLMWVPNAQTWFAAARGRP